MATAVTPKRMTTSLTLSSNIRVYNTLTKEKESFQTVEPGKVGIYLCGPTVYKEAHIGHMVGPVIFDTIKRYLTYCGYHTRFVVNITDVDDKIIAQSQERGISMFQVATEMTMDYMANLKSLGVDQIDAMPRATEHIRDIIDIIQKLIDKGFAYPAGNDVFFEVGKDREYGKLSNRKADEQQGEGGDAASRKRSPGDFALWKSAKPGEPAWESPWGRGRPGWHIECSAMSKRTLGESFDIHGGGLDLLFPHHENEIAQSECCHGKPFARYWLHNGLMRADNNAGKVGGKNDRDDGSQDAASGKISRSKGAGGLANLIEKVGGDKLRFFLLRTHYRSTIVFSEAAVEEAGSGLESFTRFFERYERITGKSFYKLEGAKTRVEGEAIDDSLALADLLREHRGSFLTKMDDDFNTGGAVSDLYGLLGALNKFADSTGLDDAAKRTPENLAALEQGAKVLKKLSALLGIFRKAPAKTAGAGDADLTGKLMDLLIALRAEARARKDFALGDRVRNGLTEAGVTLEDRKDGTLWRKA